MRESTMYQAILREGQAAGEQALVLKLLTRKLGSLSPEFISRVSALNLDSP
jgi:predicted transposase YdaD